MAGITLWLQLGNDMKKLAKPSKTARIVQSARGWYVLWYSDNVRYRLKNGLNTISCLEKRLYFANRIVHFIDNILLSNRVVRDIDLPSNLFDFSSPVEIPTQNIKFLAYFKLHIQRLEKQNLSFYTVRKHQTALNNLLTYAESVGKTDFDFLILDKAWAKAYQAWRFEPPRAHHINYVSKDFDIIRHIIEEAETEDDIKVNQKYRGDAFRIKKMVSDEIALTFAEVSFIYDLNLTDERKGMGIVRDNFVLACLTGMRFGTWALTKDNVVLVEGRQMLKVLTEKNYKTVLIPLHPIVFEILKKYDFNVPTLSNQKTNQYIKRVGELAGLTEKVVLKDSRGGKVVTDKNLKFQEMTTHTARRTFVTIALTEWRIPPQYVMMITGHATERQLYEYARIEKNRAALEVAKIFDTFTQKIET